MSAFYHFYRMMILKDEGKIDAYKAQLNALTKKELVQFIFFLVSSDQVGAAIAEDAMEDYVRPSYFEKEGKEI